MMQMKHVVEYIIITLFTIFSGSFPGHQVSRLFSFLDKILGNKMLKNVIQQTNTGIFQAEY